MKVDKYKRNVKTEIGSWNSDFLRKKLYELLGIKRCMKSCFSEICAVSYLLMNERRKI